MVEAASVATDGEISAMWIPNPTVRGTFTILSTCVSTLIICVWSALHMDIPSRSSRWKPVFRKLGWMALGLLAPELLLFLATMQCLFALYILQQSKDSDMRLPPQFLDVLWHNKWYLKFIGRTPAAQLDEEQGAIAEARLVARPDKEQDTTPKMRQHPWTLTHSFYACMGGYVFDFPSDDPNTPGERFTITPHGVRFLMKYDSNLIPDISANSIASRSKANGLAKAILLVQVLWFCTSCVARHQQRLPLSLLEITTLAHTLYTLLTYYMWFAKPLDISEPTVITGPEAKEICALMLMCSQRRKYFFGIYRVGDTDVEMDHVKLELSSSSTIDDNGERSLLTSIKWLVDGSRQSWYVRASPAAVAEPGADDRLRWKHARNAVDRYRKKFPDSEWHKHTLVERHSSLGASMRIEISERRDRFIVAFAVTCLPAGYAAHFIGWNSHFSSDPEDIVWKIAIATMICCSVIMCIVALTGDKMPFRLYLALLVVATVSYLSSSMYIVVESFRQLLYLPQEAYDLPSSSIYWPRFS